MIKKVIILFLLVSVAMAAPTKGKKEKDGKDNKPKETKLKKKDILPYSKFPVTAEMCEEDEFKDLRICMVSKQDEFKLSSIVHEYQCLFEKLDRQEPYEEGDSPVDTPSTSENNTIGENALSSSSASASFGFNGAYQGNSLLGLGNQAAFPPLQRKRRSTSANNPCAGLLSNVVVYQAQDLYTNQVYDLVHDPGNGLYQRFYVRACATYYHTQFKCEAHDIIYKTLVYLYPPEVSNEEGIKNVRISGSCALSYK